jgi:hypothetical protein
MTDEFARELRGARDNPERLARVLARAGRRDCMAAGLGCTRRLDRSCREPEVCAQDPAELVSEGPAPGACDRFYAIDFAVWFSPRDRHRAVITREPAALWVDGVRAGPDQTLDIYGRWLDDRYFVVQCEGPDDHPAQTYQMGSLVSQIVSLLVFDADLMTTTILMPGPEDLWTNPWPERDGENWIVRPS